VTKVFNKLITFLCIFHFSMGHAQFSLDQIPAIENKKTLNLVAETGFWTEHLKENMLPKFTAQTGIEVMSSPLLSIICTHCKQNL
jgi:multiple sugar transport system substrate-binding protein